MKLSIITINFNNKAGLQKTIDSVVSQTWRDFEWIIVDGGSTDGSKELIEEYAKQGCFAWWCSEPDKGVYNAMNKGIAQAKGEYLNFMNSGDSFHEITTLQQVFDNGCMLDSCILYGDALFIFETHTKLVKYSEWISIHGLYNKNICHQSMFIKKQVLATGFDESYKVYADWKQWILAAYQGFSFKYIEQTICDYDANGLSMSSNRQLLLEEHTRILLETVPQAVQNTINDINVLLQDTKYNPELMQVNSYIHERRLFYRIINASLTIIRSLKKIGF